MKKLELIYTNHYVNEPYLNSLKIRSGYHSDNDLIFKNEDMSIMYQDVMTFYLEVMDHFSDINYLENEEMWKDKLDVFVEEYGELPSFILNLQEKDITLLDILMRDHIISCKNRGFNNIDDKVYFIMKPYQVSYVDKETNETLIKIETKNGNN